MRTHTVIFNGGAQSIVTVPYGADGRPEKPSGATYRIIDLRVSDEDDDYIVVAAGAVGSVNDFAGTLDVAAGPSTDDPRLIDLDSSTTMTSMVEGSTYMLEDSTGQRVEIIADRVDVSGKKVYARNRIPLNFPIGSILKGVQVTATFPSDEAADEDNIEEGGGPYAIDWVFTGVIPTRARELIFIRRTTMRMYATTSDLLTYDQTADVGGNAVRIDVACQQAHRDFQAACRSRGIDPSRLDSEHCRDAIVARWAFHIRFALREMESAKEHNKRWSDLLNDLLEGKKPIETVLTDNDDVAEMGTSTAIHSKWVLT